MKKLLLVLISIIFSCYCADIQLTKDQLNRLNKNATTILNFLGKLESSKNQCKSINSKYCLVNQAMSLWQMLVDPPTERHSKTTLIPIGCTNSFPEVAFKTTNYYLPKKVTASQAKHMAYIAHMIDFVQKTLRNRLGKMTKKESNLYNIFARIRRCSQYGVI